MKNTTQIATILSTLSTDKKKIESATKQLQAIINTYSATRVNPGILNADGTLVAKWCSKHKQYELATTFPANTRSKDGLYSHCRYAEKRAKSYSAKVQKLKDEFFKTEDGKKQAEIKSKIADIELVKNNYDFKEDVPTDIYKNQIKFEKDYKSELA
jgi:hypothetical protein